METMNSIIKSLRNFDNQQQANEEGISSLVWISDDNSVKVAVVKGHIPKVFEIIKYESVNDIVSKDRKSIKAFGTRNTAQIVYKLLKKEVLL